jgi:recombination DNA repair RAD52 pathway protein
MTERGTLAPEQVDILLRPIRSNRVLQAQGQSHIPSYDVVAHLTRLFGFEGWDKEVLAIDLVGEDAIEKGGRVGYTVTYRCLMRLTVRDRSGRVVKVVEDGACGSANNLPSRGDAHDFAYKNAISYAIKRCAKDWGDQFGLSLYNKGSQKALVGKIVETSADDVDSHIEEPQTLGNDERETTSADEADT